MSVTDIDYTLETTDKATDKDQLVVISDILGYYNLYHQLEKKTELKFYKKKKKQS